MAGPTTISGTDSSAAHAWDKAAEGWDRHAPMLDAWLQAATTAMLDAAGVGPGSSVLDVAAGAGDQTLAIARRVGPKGHVLATDISPRILALAAEKLHRAGFDAVQTCVADAQALDLGRGPHAQHVADGFDAVVCRLGLMLCPNPFAALTQALQALRPGGRFGALVFSAPQANPCITTLVATIRRHAGLPPAIAVEPGSLLSLGQPGLMAELMARAGFVHIDVRPMAAPMRLPDVGDYLHFIRNAASPIMALLAALPAQTQDAAWEDIERQLDRFTTNGTWVGPNELLLCSASRPRSDRTEPFGTPASIGTSQPDQTRG